MKLKFFGTSAAEGVPGLFCECEVCTRSMKLGGRNIRTRSQALINDTILIDLPPDTLYHVQHFGLKLHNINHLFITHAHSDHLLASDLLEKRTGHAASEFNKTPITVYGSMPTIDKIFYEIRKVADITMGHWILKELQPFSPVTADGHTVIPYRANHAFNLHPLIYSVDDGEKCLLYAHDTGYFLAETWEKLKENKAFFHLVSLDCTAGIKDTSPEHHMNISLCSQVRDRMIHEGFADSKTVFILNHFAHTGLCTYDSLSPIAEKEGFIVSYDGMEIEV